MSLKNPIPIIKAPIVQEVDPKVHPAVLWRSLVPEYG